MARAWGSGRDGNVRWAGLGQARARTVERQLPRARSAASCSAASCSAASRSAASRSAASRSAASCGFQLRSDTAGLHAAACFRRASRIRALRAHATGIPACVSAAERSR